MEYVFAAPPIPSVAVSGESARFPVRRIFCVGRNYASHSREMGGDPTREQPFFFTKPADAVVDDGATVPYPPLTTNFHHEAELVVAIGKAGADIPADQALDHVYGYAPGNDLTRRDLQNEAKEKRRPWDWSKGFDNSAVCGAIHKAAQVGHVSSGALRLTVNGIERQAADLEEMIWGVPDIIRFLSQSVRIAPGDLVFTGTPAGIGPLVPGDVCMVTIEKLGQVTTTIGERAGP